jgi:hypothetical protein
MPPSLSSSSSMLLFSLLALGSLSGSSVNASPALQERQFGTGTGSGSGGCAALVASGNYSQSPPCSSFPLLRRLLLVGNDTVFLSLVNVTTDVNPPALCDVMTRSLDTRSVHALGRPGVLGVHPVFGEREDEHVGLYQGDVDSGCVSPRCLLCFIELWTRNYICIY